VRYFNKLQSNNGGGFVQHVLTGMHLFTAVTSNHGRKEQRR
jgi:hypothetical protein